MIHQTFNSAFDYFLYKALYEADTKSCLLNPISEHSILNYRITLLTIYKAYVIDIILDGS